MKTKIYTFLIMLATLLPTATLRAEVITGISESFAFGDATAVPLSSYALVLIFSLIGVLFYRSYHNKKKQTV